MLITWRICFSTRLGVIAYPIAEFQVSRAWLVDIEGGGIEGF
jgi:hypothetical protein